MSFTLICNECGNKGELKNNQSHNGKLIVDRINAEGFYLSSSMDDIRLECEECNFKIEEDEMCK